MASMMAEMADWSSLNEASNLEMEFGRLASANRLQTSGAIYPLGDRFTLPVSRSATEEGSKRACHGTTSNAQDEIKDSRVSAA